MAAHARGVFHMGMTVSDVERSCAFYGALGFEPQQRFRSGGPALGEGAGVPGGEVDIIIMAYDGFTLELIQHTIAGAQAPPRNNDVGAAHVCVRVDGLLELHERLAAEGVSFYSPPQRYRDECLWVYLRDPDGITVELLEVL